MKIAYLFFLTMIAAVALRGTSLAAQASPAPQQATSQGSEKSASGHTSGTGKDGEVRGEKDQARSGEADDMPGATRATTKRRSSATLSKPTPSRQLHPAKTPATNGPQTGVRGSVTGPQQPASKTAQPVPGKAIDRRIAIPPPSTVAVNGQQFRNPRHPGARLAISGGPVTAARGTAVINGTNMKRKP